MAKVADTEHWDLRRALGGGGNTTQPYIAEKVTFHLSDLSV